MDNGTPILVTEGTGRHRQLADRAELDVGFAVAGPDRSAAVGALGRLIAAAQPALEHPALTVRHRRLWVTNEWRKNRVTGCRAGEQIALVVDDVTALAEVLAALVAAEPAELHGPRWTLHDPSSALREAQRLAVADARARAQGYAAALDGRLGALRRLSESSGPGYSPVMRMMSAAADSGSDVRDLGLEPEPVEVTVQCTTTWDLLL